MYRFHVFIHARPTGVSAGESIEWRGQKIPTLDVQPDRLNAPLAVSFEEASDALGRLPGMFCEPDGSFVWRPDKTPEWQIDGLLSDREGRLLFVELKGACRAEDFDALLRTIGWPVVKLVFQLVPQAVFVDEASFRRAVAITEA